MALLMGLRRMGRGDLTTHGFRSSFRTWAAERTGFPREVVEAALAHVIGDKVEAAYQRGDLFDKRRRLDGGMGEILRKSSWRSRDGGAAEGMTRKETVGIPPLFPKRHQLLTRPGTWAIDNIFSKHSSRSLSRRRRFTRHGWPCWKPMGSPETVPRIRQI